MMAAAIDVVDIPDQHRHALPLFIVLSHQHREISAALYALVIRWHMKRGRGRQLDGPGKQQGQRGERLCYQIHYCDSFLYIT